MTNTRKRMSASIVAIVLLAICLTITTFVIVYATVAVEESIFRTGRIKINLNDGEPVIHEDEFLFEPGMTVKKEFFIENLSTWDVYYKLYFGNVEGELAKYIQVKILDGNDVVYSGSMGDLSGEEVKAVADPLEIMEKKTLDIEFYFPKESGNISQALSLKFDMYADAVQTKNNPEKEFD